MRQGRLRQDDRTLPASSAPEGKASSSRRSLLQGDARRRGDAVHQHEVFGPVATVMPYTDPDEAIALVAAGGGWTRHEPSTSTTRTSRARWCSVSRRSTAGSCSAVEDRGPGVAAGHGASSSSTAVPAVLVVAKSSARVEARRSTCSARRFKAIAPFLEALVGKEGLSPSHIRGASLILAAGNADPLAVFARRRRAHEPHEASRRES